MKQRHALQLSAAGALFFCCAVIGAPATRAVRDDTGAQLRVPADNCRIVSLAPGTTAMLYAAGAGRCLVGTIAHSKEPAEAAQVPVVGDAETLDFENLLALRPTVVVVAVDVVQRVRIDRIRGLGIPVYEVHVTSLEQMPASLRRLGALTATAAAANREAGALAAKMQAHRARLPRPDAGARAVPDLGPAYLYDRRQTRDQRCVEPVRRQQCVRGPRLRPRPR